MKILFICPSLPINNSSGGSIRSHVIHQQLGKHFDVSVVTCSIDDPNYSDATSFRKHHAYLGNIKIPSYLAPFSKNRPLSNAVQLILEEENYDFIFVRYYINAYWLGLFGLPNLILDCDDCFIDLLDQGIIKNYVGRFRYFKKYFRKNGIKNLYIKNINSAHKVIFAKNYESIDWKDSYYIFRNKIFGQQILDSDNQDQDLSQNCVILFIGVLEYEPNYEGLDYFLSQVWPLVQAQSSSIVLNIVGAGLPEQYRKKWESIDGVVICGYLDDIAEAYQDINFSIIPVYSGSGTHIKILESLSRGKTIVMPHFANRGYEDILKDEESVMLVRSETEYAEKIIRLSKDPSLAQRMAKIGKQLVAKHYFVSEDDDELYNIVIDNDR